ncbi:MULTISPECIES: helix-turn-helix domain-containing protein [Chryseobacterium]|uniref:AraC family transcriptional activator of pobA n=1 Tax=Chryseobacterium camelliae TaxID=1265445 RepID=A0ABU0TE50_9FLAO|nr:MULTISPECIES: helix-turn-helix transcriptional regulator [Chryseobacterium]MDT3406850.1 AraC family transcriptional activator of pobA [Pseudacidovorax intermedius]MDQ1095354.1 AraC family transcriptional activator of pobA [Chryseobacterium camelliae]MDQ1099292.1 AraC family transcriptional activator of pobA [Chryseobacterium sp. SORGH_AS_1048]MDR6086641.1 AraC family transcriptional activator of pobA [Chryseobacterium sp. SORGH_AS_0909]MDR6131013.1 AraC family transcriptional activator of p
MERMQSLEEFYRSKFNRVPDNIRNEVGHFNVFTIDEYIGKNSKPVVYSRKDYFKITLIIGRNRIHYADKVIEIQKQALFFTNPQIPYKFEWIDDYKSGIFCVFTPAFFHHFGNLNDYEVFQPNVIPVFELRDEQLEHVSQIFRKMQAEIVSDYVHKYDLIRNQVFDLLHYTLKMQPALKAEQQHINASQRITHLFLELLERQFPVEDTGRQISFRSPSQFAGQLSVHTNHLNRAVKEVTEKTTSEVIAERLLQEAKILLWHTEWNVSEIAYSLGFKEAAHFNNFFRKHLQMTPVRFREMDRSHN